MSSTSLMYFVCTYIENIFVKRLFKRKYEWCARMKIKNKHILNGNDEQIILRHDIQNALTNLHVWKRWKSNNNNMKTCFFPLIQFHLTHSFTHITSYSNFLKRYCRFFLDVPNMYTLYTNWMNWENVKSIRDIWCV